MQMRRVTIALSLVGLAGVTVAPAAAQNNPPASQGKGIYRGAFKPTKFDVSPPLRSIPIVITPQHAEEEMGDERSSGLEGPLGPQDVDRSVQTRVGPAGIPPTNISFDAFDGLGSNPPDPTGEVGPGHFFAAANLRFAIYSRTGTLLFGPANHNTIYAGFGGPCETTNSGDPIVLYDQLADRWVFGRLTQQTILCMAVTTSGDPMGTWNRYAFASFGSLPDYPKWGVWPDAYYFSSRDFSGPFIGVGAYAVDRAAILAGNPSPTLISFLAPPTPAFNVGDGLLPADLDGIVPPPAGSPNYFVGTMDNGGPYGAPQDAITFWKFQADFVTPANSTFTLTNTLPVDPFDSIFPCTPSARACIPQPPPTGATQKLDHLGYRQRPTMRLAYRNHTTHQSLVTNQSVEAPANIAGIRWYEIRVDAAGTPSIFQQGTFSPGATDGIHRWMGSISQDRSGNMGLSYSVSDGISVFPGIRYTGRLSTDPPGTMPQGEGTIVNGIGAQLTTNNRWGDYTAIASDPLDDCTFWAINEYYPVSSNTIWRLRVGSFTFPVPECIPVPVTLQGFAVE